MKKYLGLIIAAGAAYYFFRKYRVGKNARFYFKAVSIKGKKLVIRIAVQNPTNSSIKLQSLAGEVYANDKLVGNVSSFTPIQIAANSETVLSFDIVPNVAGLINLISNFVKTLVKKTQKLGLRIKLDGTANVDGISLPVNISYTL